MKKLTIIFLMLQIMVLGCSHDEKTFESGYDDGYAEGFNTQCEVSKISIYGHYLYSYLEKLIVYKMHTMTVSIQHSLTIFSFLN